MATITSSSTWTQIEAAYLDNLSYLTANSRSQALAFIEACSAMLIKASQATKDGESLRWERDLIAAEKAAAVAFIQVSGDDANAGVKHLSLEGFRT